MDQEKMEAFVGKVLGDTSATMTSLLAILGDRLGLFKDMAANGATTPAELASRTNTNRENFCNLCPKHINDVHDALRRYGNIVAHHELSVLVPVPPEPLDEISRKIKNDDS